jgi:predicted PurR-regulated permease PerM
VAPLPPPPRLPKRLLALTTLALLVALLYWAQKVFVPVAMAVLLAFILTPVVAWLERRALKRVVAVPLVTVLVVLLLAGLGWAAVRQFGELLQNLVEHRDEIAAKLSALQGDGWGPLGDLSGTFRDLVPAAPAPNPAGDVPAEPVPVREEPSLLTWLPRVAWSLAEGVAVAVFVIVLVAFILMRREELRGRLFRLAGHGQLVGSTRTLDEAGRRVSRYLFTLCCVNAGFGLCAGLGLALVGVPFALLWGVLAGVFRFIPIVGPWLGVLFPLAFSLTTAPDWTQPALALCVLGLLEGASDNFIEPYVYGQSVGILPVMLIVSAAFWTLLWGPAGLVMATPLTICVLVLARQLTPFRFLDTVLGDRPALRVSDQFYQRLIARDPDEAADLVERHLAGLPVEQVYDEVLLPALVSARRDRARGVLLDNEERFILQATREVIEEAVHPEVQRLLAGAEPPPAPVVALGCPACGEADELALHMLRQLLGVRGYHLAVAPARVGPAEVVQRTRQERPALVVIAALPPCGLAQVRRLWRRFRREFPDTEVLVLRWGRDEAAQQDQALLTEAGIRPRAGSLLEARDEAVALLRLTGRRPPGPREEGPLPAGVEAR